MKKTLLLFLFGISIFHSTSAQCNAKFTYSINSNTVTFFPADSMLAGTSLWYMGDGSLNYGSYLSYGYNSPGTYTVKHLIMDTINHCTDSSVQTITVQFSASCNASFAYVTDSTKNNDYYFYDRSIIVGTSLQSTTWTVNGAVVSNDETFGYSFPQSGNYTVCQQIRTVSGCTSSNCQDISITYFDSCSLSASFTDTADSSHPGKINFLAAPDTTKGVKYTWYFGDNTTDSSMNPSHTYSNGIYGVTLLKTVSSDSVVKCSASYASTVYVNIGPADTCAVSIIFPAEKNILGIYNFSTVSGQPISSEQWTIVKNYDSLNAVILNAINPTYTFPDSAIYSISLTAITQAGCVASATTNVFIDSLAQNIVVPNSATEIHSFPNPATNTVNLQLTMTSANPVLIDIYGSTGNLLISNQYSGYIGDNLFTIPVGNLKSGVYFIEISYGSNVKRSRFQKL